MRRHPRALRVLCVRGLRQGQPDPTQRQRSSAPAARSRSPTAATRSRRARAPRRRSWRRTSSAPTPTPRLVHLGLVGDPKTSIVVQWRTVDEVDARRATVRLRAGCEPHAGPADRDSAPASSSATRPPAAIVFRQHQVHLCGLTRGHDVQLSGRRSSDGRRTSRRSTRSTPRPTSPRTPTPRSCSGSSAIAAAATTSGSSSSRQIQQRMPDLILFSGDAVTVGITQYEWEDFFGRAEPLFATVAGDHRERQPRGQRGQLLLADRAARRSAELRHRLRVRARHGRERHAGGSDRRSPAPVPRRDRRRLRRRATRRAGSCSCTTSRSGRRRRSHGSSTTLQAAWQPLIDAHHIDLVLNGHDHDYEVTKPLVGMNVQPTIATTRRCTSSRAAPARSCTRTARSSGPQYSESNVLGRDDPRHATA